MDVFRSATLAIAVVILIFMGMIMYYEFKVNSTKVQFPPYSSSCPDYSYEYDYGDGKPYCKFNDSFVDNYKKLNNTFSPSQTKNNNGALCPGSLQCLNLDGGSWVNCNYSSDRDQVIPPKEMRYVLNKNKRLNIQNIKKCHLTLDGIV